MIERDPATYIIVSCHPLSDVSSNAKFLVTSVIWAQILPTVEHIFCCLPVGEFGFISSQYPLFTLFLYSQYVAGHGCFEGWIMLLTG